MQEAINTTLQDLDVQIAWKSLMQTGKFSANDMTILIHIWAYHYFGGKHMIDSEYYEDITGVKDYEYRNLRSKLRKVGIFSYEKGTKGWLIRRPDSWLSEFVGRSAHEAAARAHRADVKTRKALSASKAIQLELV